MKKKYFVVGLAALILLMGCTSAGVFPHSAKTDVDLTKKNFRIVKTDIIGTSSGFTLLWFIPIVPPSYSRALDSLYKKANYTAGSAQVLSNVVQEETRLFCLLFSIPTIKVRADIIEFLE